MACECPDTRFFADLADLNREFLGLLRRAGPVVDGPVLGLDPVCTQMLSSLGETELNYIAETPCLLAEFAMPERLDAPAPLPIAGLDPDWSAAVTMYSVALLSFLRATLGRDQLIAALCVGPLPAAVSHVADLSLGGVRGYATQATGCLRARLADVPTFWPDLIRAARSRDSNFRVLSRIAAIPLVVVNGSSTRQRAM